MLVPHAAIQERAPLRETSEETPVVFLEVGVAVPAGGAHAVRVADRPRLGVVFAALPDMRMECNRQLEVDGVFAGFEELVVVDGAPAPVLGLVVQDVALLVRRIILGAPQDAVGVRVAGRDVVVERPVVAGERLPVVIPVAGHGEGVGGEGAEEGVVQAHVRS